MPIIYFDTTRSVAQLRIIFLSSSFSSCCYAFFASSPPSPNPSIFLPTYIQNESNISTSTRHPLHSSSNGSAILGGVKDTQTQVPPGRNTLTMLLAMRGRNQSNASEHAMASKVPLSTAASKVASAKVRLHASITNHWTPGRSADSGRPCSMHAAEKSMLEMFRQPRSYMLHTWSASIHSG